MDAGDGEQSSLVEVIFPHHYDTLLGGLWQLLSGGHQVDHELRAGGRKVGAHQLVTDLFLPPQPNDAEIESKVGQPDAEPGSGLHYLLEFMYRGRVSVRQEHLHDLLLVARELNFKVLADAVENIFISRMKDLSSENSVVWVPEIEMVETELAGSPEKGRRGRQKIRPVQSSTPGKADRHMGSRPNPTVKRQVEPRGKGRFRCSNGAASQRKRAPAARSKVSVEEKSDQEEVGDPEQGKTPHAVYYKAWRQRQPLLSCEFQGCEYETRNKALFRIHQARHDPSVPIFRCSECSKAFTTDESLQQHLRIHAVEKGDLFPCPYCDYVTKKKQVYRSHLNHSHREEIGLDRPGEPREKKLKCRECDFAAIYKCQLKLHVLTRHSSERPFKCEHCSYSSIRKADVDKHVRVIHRGIRPFMCDLCGQKFAHKNGLLRHQLSHTGEKPFHCEICDKAYSDRGAYKRHVCRHLMPDDKPYVCHLCGHASRRRDNLRVHLRGVHKVAMEQSKQQMEVVTIKRQNASPSPPHPMMMMMVPDVGLDRTVTLMLQGSSSVLEPGAVVHEVILEADVLDAELRMDSQLTIQEDI